MNVSPGPQATRSLRINEKPTLIRHLGKQFPQIEIPSTPASRLPLSSPAHPRIEVFQGHEVDFLQAFQSGFPCSSERLSDWDRWNVNEKRRIR